MAVMANVCFWRIISDSNDEDDVVNKFDDQDKDKASRVTCYYIGRRYESLSIYDRMEKFLIEL